MLRVYGRYNYLILSARVPSLESDVNRRQILMSKNRPRDQRVNMFISIARSLSNVY